MKRDKIFLMIFLVGVTTFAWGSGKPDAGQVDSLLNKYEIKINECSLHLKETALDLKQIELGVKTTNPGDDFMTHLEFIMEASTKFTSEEDRLVKETGVIVEEIGKVIDYMSDGQRERCGSLLDRMIDYHNQSSEYLETFQLIAQTLERAFGEQQ
jgi:hypothetical protein